MEIFGLIDNKIILIIALSVIIILANLNMNKKEKLNKLFIRLTGLVLITLILEIFSIIIPISNSPALIPIHKLVNIMGFTISPIIPYMWVLYVAKKLDTRINNRILAFPIFINMIIVALSYKYRLIFSVDLMNKYSREALFFVPAGMSCIYFAYAVFILIMKRKKGDRREIIALMIFCIIPYVGVIIQIAFSNILAIWNYTGISIIIYYVYLRERTFKYDGLTGAWNRVAFEAYINNSLSNNNTAFSLAYIDIDNFKAINDTYGHDEGDIALKTVVALLQNIFQSRGTVVRMGGDEFIVIIYSSKKYIVDNMIEHMKLTFIEHNKKTDKPYKIKFSCGYDGYDEKYKDIDTLVKHVDKLMYLDKNSKSRWDRETGTNGWG